LAAVATAFHQKDRRKEEGKKNRRRRGTYWIFTMPFAILRTSTEGPLTL